MSRRTRLPVKQRNTSQQPWSNEQVSTPWGRVSTAFGTIIDHINDTPDASVLLAAGSSQTFVSMHGACEHFLPQAGGWRVAGVWFFPNKSRLRVSRLIDMADAASISSRRFSLISVHAEAEVIAILEPLLSTGGRIIPFFGTR